MGMAEGYRRIFEQQREKWRRFNCRLLAVGLPEATRQDFDDSLGGQHGEVRPRTRTGWAIFVVLREKEGGLSAKDREDVKYGLEGILISEKMKEIQVRLESGGTLPDPSWPDTSPPIPADIALSQRARSILHWSSIKELGLDKDEHYNWVYSSARSQMYDIAQQRGDVEEFFESLRPAYVAASASAQEPQLPTDYRQIEIQIPIDALRHKSDSLDFVRYHPEFGLVHGCVSEDSCYDRGAGSYPGSRGARVKMYWPFVRLLLEDVDFRKCKGIRKQSVWRVAGDPPVILGRDKSTVGSRNALSYGEKFDTRENALSFMAGSIESKFVQDTLPVIVERISSGFRLRLNGRTLP